MATKENYQNAIMRMYNFCISSNHPAQIREQFTQDLDFLAKLAEEHFEEKQETNLERYYDDLLEEGYFNDVDKNESIKDILAKCEVIEDRKEVIKND